MRILDIDLDAFVTPIKYGPGANCGRLRDEDYEIQSTEQVIEFLEDKCGLSKATPTLGCVFEDHDELFHCLKALIASKQVVPPFELIHVDAHADLGAGGSSKVYEYLLTDVMHKASHDRTSPRCGTNALNAGTFVLFMIACEWLSKFYYVFHPDDGKDFCELFLDYEVDGDQLSLQIPRCDKDDFRKWKPPFTDTLNWRDKYCQLGPAVPFSRSKLKDFQSPGYDMAFLTRSPCFTPPKADALFEVIRSYISPIIL